MFDIGWSELLLVGTLALVLIGPKRLPEVARALGKTWRQLRGALDEATGDIRRELEAASDEAARAGRDTRAASAPGTISNRAAMEERPAPTASPGPDEVTADPDLASFIDEVTGPRAEGPAAAARDEPPPSQAGTSRRPSRE